VVESVVGVGEVGVVGERGGPSFSRPFSPSLGLRREWRSPRVVAARRSRKFSLGLATGDEGLNRCSRECEVRFTSGLGRKVSVLLEVGALECCTQLLSRGLLLRLATGVLASSTNGRGESAREETGVVPPERVKTTGLKGEAGEGIALVKVEVEGVGVSGDAVMGRKFCIDVERRRWLWMSWLVIGGLLGLHRGVDGCEVDVVIVVAVVVVGENAMICTRGRASFWPVSRMLRLVNRLLGLTDWRPLAVSNFCKNGKEYS